MNIRQLIDAGLQYVTKRRDNMATKNISRQRQNSAGTTTPVCGSCGGEIVEVNKISHRRACFKCGKEAQ